MLVVVGFAHSSCWHKTLSEHSQPRYNTIHTARRIARGANTPKYKNNKIYRINKINKAQ